MSASVTINGVTITGSNSVSIINGKVIVDGKEVDTGEAKTIYIDIVGYLLSLNADHCNMIRVKGSVDTVKTMSGSVDCGNVTGNVQTMSGNVHAGTVDGSVTTMSGDIRHK
jgi:hypothetical protein